MTFEFDYSSSYIDSLLQMDSAEPINFQQLEFPSFTALQQSEKVENDKKPQVEKDLGHQICKAKAGQPKRNSDGKFACPQCDRAYTHNKHLRRHMLRHTGEKPYSCRYCLSCYSRPDIKKRHEDNCKLKRAFTNEALDKSKQDQKQAKIEDEESLYKAQFENEPKMQFDNQNTLSFSNPLNFASPEIDSSGSNSDLAFNFQEYPIESYGCDTFNSYFDFNVL